MRIMTFNANGIRSAASKGFFNWLPRQEPTWSACRRPRRRSTRLGRSGVLAAGYHCYYFDAEKKGYSGAALYSRRKPATGHPRIRGRTNSIAKAAIWRRGSATVSVVSLYLPSGSSGPERQASKFRFLEAFRPHLRKLQRARRACILCGDWNIAHKPIDLKNWKSNQKNSGFLPEERAWLDELFGPAVSSTRSAQTNTSRTSTPGGRTAARPTPKTSVGASTITSRAERLRGKVEGAPAFTKSGGFPTTRRCIIDYDLEF